MLAEAVGDGCNVKRRIVGVRKAIYASRVFCCFWACHSSSESKVKREKETAFKQFYDKLPAATEHLNVMMYSLNERHSDGGEL